METFFEQIIKIKATPKKRCISFLIVFAAFLITAVGVVLLLRFLDLLFLIFLLLAGVWFGAYKLVCDLKTEFEYIVTNGELDIVLIINQSRRKKYISVSCKEIEKIEKFNFDIADLQDKKLYICCNKDDDAFALTVRDGELGVIKIVIAPNEKIATAIKKYLPRYLLKDAFIQ